MTSRVLQEYVYMKCEQISKNFWNEECGECRNRNFVRYVVLMVNGAYTSTVAIANTRRTSRGGLNRDKNRAKNILL